MKNLGAVLTPNRWCLLPGSILEGAWGFWWPIHKLPIELQKQKDKVPSGPPFVVKCKWKVLPLSAWDNNHHFLLYFYVCALIVGSPLCPLARDLLLPQFWDSPTSSCQGLPLLFNGSFIQNLLKYFFFFDRQLLLLTGSLYPLVMEVRLLIYQYFYC